MSATQRRISILVPMVMADPSGLYILEHAGAKKFGKLYFLFFQHPVRISTSLLHRFDLILKNSDASRQNNNFVFASTI